MRDHEDRAHWLRTHVCNSTSKQKGKGGRCLCWAVPACGGGASARTGRWPKRMNHQRCSKRGCRISIKHAPEAALRSKGLLLAYPSAASARFCPLTPRAPVPTTARGMKRVYLFP